jgi:antirestriction protein ArdC
MKINAKNTQSYEGEASEAPHWVNRAIFTAASKAQQAADYLRSFSEQLEEAA